MAGIDVLLDGGWRKGRTSIVSGMTMPLDSSQTGVRGDFNGVGFQHGAARAVIDDGSDLGGNVLDQCASAPYVESLSALADRENRLVKVEGVLD